MTPEDHVTDLGAAEIRLACQATGEPQPHVSWSHNGVQLGPSPRLQLEPEGSLIIRNVQASDYGIYRCEAANYLGRISANAQIKINCKINSMEKIPSQFCVAKRNCNSELKNCYGGF